ncbi:MAG: hypothetical protein J6U86_04220 [Clostridia bacterium]|nr:hypothetical protein [Clostridia bacterium]
MKRILLMLVVIAVLLTLCCTSVMAEGTDVTEAASHEDLTQNVDAEQFVKYIFSGEEGSEELMSKIIEMGDQYLKSKEQGYTFKERMLQLFTAENIVVISASAFIVICGVGFFIIEAKRKKDRRVTKTYIARLEKKYGEEVASNIEIKEAVRIQSDIIEQLLEKVDALCEASEANKLDLDNVTKASQAVAKMVKDVFINSKTIDANAKSLLIHNYLEAVEALEVIADEQQAEI